MPDPKFGDVGTFFDKVTGASVTFVLLRGWREWPVEGPPYKPDIWASMILSGECYYKDRTLGVGDWGPISLDGTPEIKWHHIDTSAKVAP